MSERGAIHKDWAPITPGIDPSTCITSGLPTQDCSRIAEYFPVQNQYRWDWDRRCVNCVPREPAPSSTIKPTNPKDAVGIKKVPASVTPREVLAEVNLGLLEGALKYGRHNYRAIGVRASVYFDATNRHLDAWWEGQNIDPGSGLNHITKAIASLVVLRDAMLNEHWEDDRPPPVKDQDWVEKLNAQAAALLGRYPEPKVAYTKENTST